MEYGTIERSIEIDASPATVFAVITSPEHLREWWPDEAVLDPTPGAIGELVFGDRRSGDAQIPQITVVEAEPARRFSFRWIYPDGETARADNSLLGHSAGYGKTEGNSNTFVGYHAGHNNTTGSSNVFLGHHAGFEIVDRHVLREIVPLLRDAERIPEVAAEERDRRIERDRRLL